MLQSLSSTEMKISKINAFSDNYIWVIHSHSNNNVVFVDPGDAQACIQYLEYNNKCLSAIFITHHHPDHIGGIEKLVNYCQTKNWLMTIYGPANETIPYCHVKLKQEDKIILDDIGFTFTIIDVPGHTLGHIAYLAQGNLFCGDTLFSGGCGRLFEGTPKQMLHSLDKLKALPDDTKVYCAHEYTLANLTFALEIEPDNKNILQYFDQVSHKRNKNIATIPSTIGNEKRINPFLRCDQKIMMEIASKYNGKTITEPLSTFTIIRSWKDNF